MSNPVMPYQFQPRRTGVVAKARQRDEPNGPDTSRLADLSWCLCGHCQLMPKAEECICCREVPGIKHLLEASCVPCVMLHQRFDPVCLNPDVLVAVLGLLHEQQASILAHPISNR